tara:strand:- start:667 stop:864 length:198 start_codon:yes stop_codon:yes gene_type:complete
MNYNQRLKRTQQIELFSFLLLIIFALCLMIQFQENCKELRGNDPIVKAPKAEILKQVSVIRSLNP